MSVRSAVLALSLGVLCGTGLVGGRATAADDDTATVRQLMLGIVIPASDGVFGVGSLIPKNDTEWDVIVADAMVLAETGRLLTQEGRAKDQEDWAKFSNQLTESALAVAKYARAKDVDKVMDGGNTLYDACDACHAKYMPNPPVR
jgi:cytochrome c556